MGHSRRRKLFANSFAGTFEHAFSDNAEFYSFFQHSESTISGATTATTSLADQLFSCLSQARTAATL
jgi:hypothetical protein